MLDYLKWGENMVGEGKSEEGINNDHIYCLQKGKMFQDDLIKI